MIALSSGLGVLMISVTLRGRKIQGDRKEEKDEKSKKWKITLENGRRQKQHSELYTAHTHFKQQYVRKLNIIVCKLKVGPSNPQNITFCVQHFGNVQVFLSYVKSQVQVPQRIILNKDTQFYISEQQCWS